MLQVCDTILIYLLPVVSHSNPQLQNFIAFQDLNQGAWQLFQSTHSEKYTKTRGKAQLEKSNLK